MDNGNSAYGYGYGVNHTQQPQREEVTFAVPASKCGVSMAVLSFRCVSCSPYQIC